MVEICECDRAFEDAPCRDKDCSCPCGHKPVKLFDTIEEVELVSKEEKTK